MRTLHQKRYITKNRRKLSEILDEEFRRKEVEFKAEDFASFGKRFWAAIIDALVFTLPGFINMYNLTEMKSLPLYILLQIPILLYKPIMEWKYGATLGKMALKIKVMSTSGQPLSLEQSFRRWIFYFVNSFTGLLAVVFTFFNDEFSEMNDFYAIAELMRENGVSGLEEISSMLVLVSCMFVLFDLKKQSLHDKLAQTYVVHTRG